MKTYFLLLLFCSPIILQAQQGEDLTIKGSKMTTKELTPKQVIDSLNKRFPDAKSIQYYKLPADAVENGWEVTAEDNLNSNADVDYYTIAFKREDVKYYGLYTKDGELLKSKVEQKVSEMPEKIAYSIKHLSETHPGYTITSQTYYKNTDRDKSKEYYEIVAKKEGTTKRLIYDMNGMLVKIK